MSEKGNNKQPEVYEFMDPGARFVSLAREIMRRHNQDPDADLDQGEISVIWPAVNTGNYYKLQKDYVQSNRGTILMAYILEHFANDYSSTKPSKRYFVAADESKEVVKTSKIYQIDYKNLPMTHNGDERKWQRDIARTALGTLGEQAPDYAGKLVVQQFDRYFETAVADYILSDYAIEGVDQELTLDTARDAVAKFRERTRKISDIVIEKSKKHGPNSGAPSPAYTDAIVEAAGHVREADGRNRYRIVEYSRVTLAAAERIKKWPNSISQRDIFKKGKEKGPEHA